MFVSLDARFDLSDLKAGQNAYRQGHILGAIYADLEQDLSGPVVPGITGRHPLPDPAVFLEKLRMWGISRKTSIVVYDDGNHAMAARAWWLLRWMGLTEVAILHGGMKGWLAGGYPVTNEQSAISKTELMLTAGAMPTITVDELFKVFHSPEYQLVDARSEERFNGSAEPIDSKAGHIPGATCHPFTRNMDEQGRFLPVRELKATFEKFQAGGRETIFYCGSGITACHNLFAMAYAGLDVGKLYPGSWSEWITGAARPTESFSPDRL